LTAPVYEVLWAESAIRDLERIVDFIALETPQAAERLFERVAEQAVSLESLPFRGRIVPELDRFEITIFRELLISPFRLMYRIEENRVLIVAVFDGRRNLEDVLLARFSR
jgi:addiction module RelE/StbE family toxin